MRSFLCITNIEERVLQSNTSRYESPGGQKQKSVKKVAKKYLHSTNSYV